jgi:hypothetical protein
MRVVRSERVLVSVGIDAQRVPGFGDGSNNVDVSLA